jgi:hypothetical protein
VIGSHVLGDVQAACIETSLDIINIPLSVEIPAFLSFPICQYIHYFYVVDNG